MKVLLKLARSGMNMEEGTITAWHKQPGERFEAGEILYSVETEKVNQDVEAPGAGTLLEIRAPAGETVAVGAVVCVVESA